MRGGRSSRDVCIDRQAGHAGDDSHEDAPQTRSSFQFLLPSNETAETDLIDSSQPSFCGLGIGIKCLEHCQYKQSGPISAVAAFTRTAVALDYKRPKFLHRCQHMHHGFKGQKFLRGRASESVGNANRCLGCALSNPQTKLFRRVCQMLVWLLQCYVI